MKEDIKRMNFYNGLFLKEEEFITEQRYHVRVRRLLNRLLNNVYGIIEGLEVKAIKGKKQYKITPGYALSHVTERGEKLSCEIVLTEDKNIDLSEEKFAGQDVYIVISYNELLEDTIAEKGDKPLHIVERPQIRAMLEHNEPSKDILLAKIKVPDEIAWTSDKNPIDISQRKEIAPAIRGINGIESTRSNNGEVELNGDHFVQKINKGSATINQERIDTKIARNSEVEKLIDGHPHTGESGKGLKISHKDLDEVECVDSEIADPAEDDQDFPKHITNMQAKEWLDHMKDHTKHSGKGYSLDSADGKIKDVVYVDNDGNVGIGTTAPWGRLHIDSFSDPGTQLSLSNKGESERWSILKRSGSFGSAHNLLFSFWDGAAWHQAIDITKNGNVGIGTVSPTYKLHVNGTAGGTSWTNTSDSRFKKNVTTITGALDKVYALRGVEFEWRKEEFPDKCFDGGKKIGLIAQEVEKALPEVVLTDNEGYKSVENANIVAVLIEAIKELKIQNEELKMKNEKLEEKLKRQNNELLSRIEALENRFSDQTKSQKSLVT